MPKKKILIVGTILVLLAGTLTAGAVRRVEEVHLRAGDILVDGYGGFRPETLPRTKDARERSERATRSERAGEAAGESACRGV